MIHIVSNESSKRPIIGTVPENIGKWRSGMAEAMHKKGLHDPFEVVETPVIHGICLDRVDNTFFFVAEKLVDWKVVNDRIEYQRT